MEPIPIEVTRAAGDLRALVGRLSRRLRQTSIVGEMTLSQASVLSLLEREGPATPGALATMERISPQSMGASPCRQLHWRRATDAYRSTSAPGTPGSVDIRRVAWSEHVR